MDEQARVVAQMSSGQPFTYMDLCFLTDGKRDESRVADKTIQRWRRRGWIAFVRVKGRPVWNLTEKGKAEITN